MDDRRLGTVLGALVGDAAGAILEFYPGNISRSSALRAMQMPGGGSLNVAPGQITDDGELTLALLGAISKHPTHASFPEDQVALAYNSWYKSNPFDIGRTCARAMGCIALSEAGGTLVTQPASYMKAKALEYNILSEANGALMRCSGIPAWYWKLPYETVAQYARIDAALSHPNEACQDCNAAYCAAISCLLGGGSSNDAVSAANSIEMCDKVREWLAGCEPENCKINIGHVKHAFQLAFYHLKKNSTYEDAILNTLTKGGDTDTNAAIVGGMMGALHGASGIPSYMTEPVVLFDCSTHDPNVSMLGYKRPAAYRASNIIKLLSV